MISILWIDDEIELLKPHIIYLESKGYSVIPVNSGNEALELLNDQKFDLVFLDPPFEDNNIVLILKNLADPKILNSDSLIIIHRHKRTIDKFDKNFKILREEVYGSSKIIFGFFSF